MEINNSTDLSDGNDSSNAYDDDFMSDFAELRKSLTIFSIIGLSLVFVLGMIGNGVVIWLTGFKMKKTVKTVWFLNLAVADFLFTAYLPLTVTYIALGFHWPFGNFMCRVNGALTFLNMFASVYILVVISVDRCVSVVWPVWAQNHRTVRKASYVSLGVWVLALIYSTPSFIFKDTYSDEEKIYCLTDFSLSNNFTQSEFDLEELRYQALTITRFFLGFLLPFTVIVSSNAVMIHRLRRNLILARRSRRPFKIIAAVIITFFLCWAPYHIMSLIELLHFTTSPRFYYVLAIGFSISTILIYLNSCINPLLYAFIGQDFKDKVCKSILNNLKTVFQDEE